MPIAFAPETSGQSASPVALAAGFWLLIGDLTFSGSYSTGGDSLDLTKYFPAGGTIRRATVLTNGVRGLSLEYDLANKKMKVWNAGAAPAVAEHTAAAYDTDLTGATVPIVMLLKG